MTQKDKLAQFDYVQGERDLLSLYLYDTQFGIEPIVVKKGVWRANLYRADGASGGYIVMREKDGDAQNTSIMYFEEAIRHARADVSLTPEFLDYRIVVERCRIERDAVWAKEEAYQRTPRG